MKLRLERTDFGSSCTIGDLYIDGVWECYILEDKVREVKGQPVSSWKIKGETAIPAGTYNTVITLSNRFKRELPLLEGVPGFEGIRIHPGNTDADTEGCLLPGREKTDRRVTDSKIAFNSLFAKIEQALNAGDTVSIEVA